MSQHDFDIANQTAISARADINNALKALASNNSGVGAPNPTYANMMWYETDTNLLKMRKEDNLGWITLGTLNQSTGTFLPSDNGVDLTTNYGVGGAARGFIAFNGSSGAVFRSSNVTLSKVGTGNYTLTMDSSMRTVGSNWVAVVGTVDTGITSDDAGIGAAGNTTIYNAFVSGRTTSTVTIKAKDNYTSFQHQGGNDNNSAYSWGIRDIDPTYISVVIY